MITLPAMNKGIKTVPYHYTMSQNIFLHISIYGLHSGPVSINHYKKGLYLERICRTKNTNANNLQTEVILQVWCERAL